MGAVAIMVERDLSAFRRLDEGLREADEWLFQWGRIASRNRPPNDWPTTTPIYRAMRQQVEGAAQSTAPRDEPAWYYALDSWLAHELTPLERAYCRYRWERGWAPDVIRRRLSMSKGKADRTCRRCRTVVAAWLATCA